MTLGTRAGVNELLAIRGHWESTLKTRRAELRRDPTSAILSRSVQRLVEHIADIDRTISKLKEGGR